MSTGDRRIYSWAGPVQRVMRAASLCWVPRCRGAGWRGKARHSSSSSDSPALFSHSMRDDAITAGHRFQHVQHASRGGGAAGRCWASAVRARPTQGWRRRRGQGRRSRPCRRSRRRCIGRRATLQFSFDATQHLLGPILQITARLLADGL